MSLFSKLSYKSRKQKLKLFYEVIKPDENTKILDLGAEINPAGDRQLQLIDSYEWRPNITAVNLSQQHIEKIKDHYPEINAQVGDATNLPFPDKSFDVVFSNAVIEHVGNFQQQQKMASEIMRVGKSWFVTTPNRWFPFEFHMRLPFVTWLPWHGYLGFGRIISYNHMKKRYDFGIKHPLRLLTPREFRKLFPDSRMVGIKITKVIPETLIAYNVD